ncbi:NAD(P)H-dependent oxidoreductase [Magnetospira sp. QH-2]|uniref:glutathione-regulated potassium-efflux system oxidoreductase KefF n=1 Tax=Magnetospira sp. (strain QH-2) TaxID=1288970 RepID=UPI0003E80D2D|nr:NAD(P)H-dependent oxidoreductase [Magnetospira sp. QH-2]CCQ74366.1 glutathione-regulated potassium-efflux system ancillary protein KefF [Magnetospira sp. QH-2]
MSRKVLVLFAHPDLGTSRINRRMVEVLADLNDVTLHDLYAAYPDFNINVRLEQERCTAHDVLVFQHPFYWYSCPALLKQWMDEVLTFGWAYGSKGTALRGKKLLSAISTGGSAQAYTPEGFHGRRVEDLLMPFDQMARLCGMSYLPPFLFHATRGAQDHDIEIHATAYLGQITALRDDGSE